MENTGEKIKRISVRDYLRTELASLKGGDDYSTYEKAKQYYDKNINSQYKISFFEEIRDYFNCTGKKDNFKEAYIHMRRLAKKQVKLDLIEKLISRTKSDGVKAYNALESDFWEEGLGMYYDQGNESYYDNLIRHTKELIGLERNASPDPWEKFLNNCLSTPEPEDDSPIPLAEIRNVYRESMADFDKDKAEHKFNNRHAAFQDLEEDMLMGGC